MSSSKPATWEFSQQFTASFQASRADIQARIDGSKATPTDSAVQDISLQLARLARSLSDAAGSIPSFDQGLYETQVKELEHQVEGLRNVKSGKTRFSFKRKQEQAPPEPPSIQSHLPMLSETLGEKVHEPQTQPQPQTQTQTQNLTLKSHLFHYLTAADLPAQQNSDAQDLTISDLTSCIVNLLPRSNEANLSNDFGAYHIRNLSNCVVLLPFSAGSALIHDLHNCVIALGCHQFRMHTSKDVDVYLDIASNPVIEDCTGIRFSLYPSKLDPDLLKRSPLKPFTVQDFSHIRASPSPNFSLMADKLGNDAKFWPLQPLSDKEDIERALIRMLPAKATSSSHE
ncbi:TBCC-domain-containing protein [Coprinopsis marcescibilis]|uniref:TBCC-domain-containing protein n=1 Tax=Coprinopsis marcescibilis TaxID=230819 RepID=A0A5C3KXH4_COPMA|nr:TBCC-domain-containing protein [Coprinopsis marcescibilis]